MWSTGPSDFCLYVVGDGFLRISSLESGANSHYAEAGGFCLRVFRSMSHSNSRAFPKGLMRDAPMTNSP